MDAIRAFVAIELPPFVLDELAQIEARFRPQVPDGCVRWVKPDSIHLTLKFLGQVPSDQIELITASLRTAVASHHAFTLNIAGAGCFPNLSRPRVVWVGVQEEGDLSRAIEYLERGGALGETIERARLYARSARDALGVCADTEIKAALADIADFVVERAY